MIDLLKAKQAFKNYVQNYNPEDEKIELKISHIERVSRIAGEIAKSLNLNEEDIKLAELIGLLHDIGRFEQVRIYHTFQDSKSINHGEFGAKLLFEDGLIREFIEDNQYDEIIKKAIINHNRGKIEDGLNDRENLHAKIIRDADKLDIFYILTTYSKQAVWESDDLSNDIISDEIYREFKEDKRIDYKQRKCAADLLVCHFAYVYDLYFKYTIQEVYKNNYLDTIYNRHHFNDKKTMKRYEDVYNTAKEYIFDNLKI